MVTKIIFTIIAMCLFVGTMLFLLGIMTDTEWMFKAGAILIAFWCISMITLSTLVFLTKLWVPEI